MCENAIEARKRAELKAQWNALLPFMSMQWLKAIDFEDYYNRAAGSTLDMRSDEEILAEVEDVRRQIRESKNGSV